MTKKYPGIFITLEGVDAAGKSSHVEALKSHLEQTTGKKVIMTREPGGTDLANEIRAIVKTRPMSAATELLLLNAARQDHIENVISKALQEGHIVLCDRFTDSTYAYQGGAKSFDMDKIAILEQWVQEGLTPDMTLYFDVPLAVSKSRRETRGEASDRMEDAMDANFNALRDVYLEIAKNDPERVVTIDGTPSLENVRKSVISHIDDFILHHSINAALSDKPRRIKP